MADNLTEFEFNDLKLIVIRYFLSKIKTNNIDLEDKTTYQTCIDLLSNYPCNYVVYEYDNLNGGTYSNDIIIKTTSSYYSEINQKKITSQIKVLIVTAFNELSTASENISFRDLAISIDKSENIEQTNSNLIKFFVQKRIGHSAKIQGHITPSEFPSFVLVEDGWNDFDYYTRFDLFYYFDEKTLTHIGGTKIISYDLSVTSTYEVLEHAFFNLTENFCSLGVNSSYYSNLRIALQGDTKLIASALFAIRDIAYYPSIGDKFSQLQPYRLSLIRENGSERALREGKFLTQRDNIEDCYKFSYEFTPPYSITSTKFDFDFIQDCSSLERIIGLIGENGAGKTQLLNAIPQAWLDTNLWNSGDNPLYSQIMTVSYSPFNGFTTSQADGPNKYIFCGFSHNVKESTTASQYINYLERIIERGTKNTNIWKETIADIINRDVEHECLELNEQFSYTVSSSKIGSFLSSLSSGELNYLLSMTALIANIRYDSLLLIDEPEQHMHPKAINAIMIRIGKILDSFKSYAIIATHSPLVIRELLSKNVYILRRSDNVLTCNKIGIESFGASISKLSDIVFGDEKFEKRYEIIIDGIIKRYSDLSFIEIIQLLENDYIPLSMNLKVYIYKTLLEKNENAASS